MVIKDFTRNDIDYDSAVKAAHIETDKIYNSESTRKGRDKKEIFRVNIISQVAEKYMIEHHGFEDDTREFMDIKKDGVTYDVKVSISGDILNKIEYLKEELAERSSWTKNVAEYILAFNYSGGANGVYKYRGMFKVKHKRKELRFVLDRIPTVKTPIKTSPEALYKAMVKRHDKRLAEKILNSYGYSVLS